MLQQASSQDLSLLEPLGKEEHLELCNQFVVQS